MPISSLTILNTGGTFNKLYNPITGELDIPQDNRALESILPHYYGNLDITLHALIHKDSLEFTDADRDLLCSRVTKTAGDVIIIHGTDTMDKSAAWLETHLPKPLAQRILFVGAMVPYSIQREEAVANLSLALGFLNADSKPDIYIAMHGLVAPFDTLRKDRTEGRFYLK